jgi:hypothetical protein
MSLFKADVPPSRVPTLTEVVEIGGDFLGTGHAGQSFTDSPANQLASDSTPSVEQALAASLPDADLLTQQVMRDVQRQIDAMLEVRLKEALAPVIARLTDSLARDTRHELTQVMKEVVSRAVANELRRTRSKP